jgi:hypothetical protein
MTFMLSKLAVFMGFGRVAKPMVYETPPKVAFARFHCPVGFSKNPIKTT